MSPSPGGYTAAQVAELLGWPVSRVYSYARQGLVSPERDGRRLVFSFQDLAVLRTARRLLDQRVEPPRISAALRRLRQRLPEGRPLSALRLEAAGTQVAMREANTLWEVGTGQAVLDLPEAPRQATDDGEDCDFWYEAAIDLEATDEAEAIKAYRRCLTLSGGRHADAHVNLGRLQQQRGDRQAARHHYQRALECEPDNAIAWFNLGTVLEDIDSAEAAISAYRRAAEGGLRDAHFNLARLFELAGDRASAIYHLRRIDKLD